MRKLRKRFITWIFSECVAIHPKRNKIFAFLRSLELKMGGATRVTMQTLAEGNGYCFLFLHFFLCRPFLAPATFYYHLEKRAQRSRDAVIAQMYSAQRPILHWVDNFARHYQANAMYFNRDLFLKLLWTAHGVKFLDPVADLKWKRSDIGDVIPAMPPLEELLGNAQHNYLLDALRQVFTCQFMVSC